MTTTLAAAVATLVIGLAVPVLADSNTTCRTDSGGHRICVKREREPDAPRERRCTETCRTDSGGHRVCRERCN